MGPGFAAHCSRATAAALCAVLCAGHAATAHPVAHPVTVRSGAKAKAVPAKASRTSTDKLTGKDVARPVAKGHPTAKGRRLEVEDDAPVAKGRAKAGAVGEVQSQSRYEAGGESQRGLP